MLCFMAKKEIHLVTGANSRTGLALCAELKSRGYYVRALIRKQSDWYAPFLEPYADEVLYADVRNVQSLDSAFEGADYVYHLAAIVSIASKIDREIEAVNIGGVRNVIDACLAHGITRLVYTGTVHTIPFKDTASVLREIPRFLPGEVDGAYAVSKSIASNLVLDAVHDRGLNAVIGMPSGIIGPFELRRSNFGQMVVDVAERKLPVSVSGRYDFVDVRDVVKALADLAFTGPAGETYILSGHAIEVKDLVRSAAEAAGVPPPKVCLPLSIVKFFSYFAEWWSLLRKQTLMFTPYAIKVLGDNCNFSHEKISALIGYSPRPLKDAIKDQVDYYLNVYKPNFAGQR
jgi:dihydroflavonol-4-reductase